MKIISLILFLTYCLLSCDSNSPKNIELNTDIKSKDLTVKDKNLKVDTLYDLIIYRFLSKKGEDSTVKSYLFDFEKKDTLLLMETYYDSGEYSEIRFYNETGAIASLYSIKSIDKVSEIEDYMIEHGLDKVYKLHVIVFDEHEQIKMTGNIETSDPREFTNIRNEPDDWIKVGEWKYFSEDQQLDSVLTWEKGKHERIK